MKDNDETSGNIIDQESDKFSNDDDFEFQFGDEDIQENKESETREKRKRFNIDDIMDDNIIIMPESKRCK